VAVRLCRVIFRTIIALGLVTAAQAQPSATGASAGAIADIVTMLDQEKLDPARLARLRREADAEPSANADRKTAATFLFKRSQARTTLGRIAEATADAEAAIEIGTAEKLPTQPYRQQLAQLYGWSGERLRSLEQWQAVNAAYKPDNFSVQHFVAARWIGINYLQLGDMQRAEVAFRRVEALLEHARQTPNWADNPQRIGVEGHVLFARAALAEARGQFHDASVLWEDSEDHFRQYLAHLPAGAQRPNVEQLAEWTVARASRTMAREGRLAEAEAEGRRALINWLRLGGKYNLNAARIITALAMVFTEQGRFVESEILMRNVLDIYDALGTAHDAEWYGIGLNQLAGIIALQGRWSDAAQAYARLDAATRTWNERRRDDELDVTRVYTLYKVGDLAGGLAAAQRLVARETAKFGADNPETALARGMQGLGLALAGREQEALPVLHAATDSLVTTSRDSAGEEDDAVAAATREHRVQTVIEAYIDLLSRNAPAVVAADDEAVTAAFRLAEGLRGHSVQKALAESAARASASTPALATLARQEQDLAKQVGAQLALLNTVLALPPKQRDDGAITDLRADIDRLREQRAAARRAIAEQFRDYAALTDPRPPRVREVRSALKPGEAYLSFYFGQEKSFVWAIPKDGPIAFAPIKLGAAELAARIAAVRRALEPDAGSVQDIPPFDTVRTYDLYESLLKPVEAGWRPAKSLIVATNGALGLLPLSLLPTARVEVDATREPFFAGYRAVPWLARTHAVSLVPSAAALITLRHLPAASARRAPLVGFGDPLFNAEQASESAAEAQVATAAMASFRGMPLRRRSAPKYDGTNRVTLASLPRLPDTADELRSVATALNADPTSIHLGKAANERAVRQTDLSHYRIVMFATHGLVPGELDGLDQPALALTAPAVAGGGGNGLLTMDKILTLKLDADWVVLSACNTGTGAGAGAEAASGLGRAFFYAGTRAVLVTNWSVHSASARDLVTDLFRRQTAKPQLSRAEALREAMVALMDGNGFTGDDGKTIFTYAHPLFWAPYSIIGDPG
jgi:CHAT domain-containing protein